MVQVTGRTPVYALVGHPVAHSGSPALHNGWFASLGIDGVYVALDVRPERGEQLAGALRALGIAGANVTVPFKQTVAAQLDGLVGLAATTGAVNTVARDVHGHLIGHNTDGDGLLDALALAGRPAVAGMRAVVVGAGGTGLVAACVLAAAGARVVVLNRTPERADRVARRAQAHAPGADIAADALDAGSLRRHTADATVVVQATDGPGAAAVVVLGPGALPAGALWLDLGYGAARPTVRAAVAARGARFADGTVMLRRQAARAFHLWTGVDPEPLQRDARPG